MYAEVLIGNKSKRWTVMEHALIGFSATQKEKHRTAQRMLETVVNSWEFRQELLSTHLTNTRGMSNGKIYETILNGAEVLSPEIDNEADIDVHSYRKWGRVIGYTLPDTSRTWLNLNFFDTYTYEKIAANLIHEWLHKLGFSHNSASERTSVPYAVGALVETLVKHLMNDGTLHDVNEIDNETDVILGASIPSIAYKPVLVCTRSWRNLWRKKCYYV